MALFRLCPTVTIFGGPSEWLPFPSPEDQDGSVHRDLLLLYPLFSNFRNPAMLLVCPVQSMALTLDRRAPETIKERPWIFFNFLRLFIIHDRCILAFTKGGWQTYIRSLAYNQSDGSRGSRSWATCHFRVGGCGNGTMRSLKGGHHICPSIAEQDKATTGADDMRERAATGRRCS